MLTEATPSKPTFGPIHAKMAKFISPNYVTTANAIATNTSVPPAVVDLALRQFVVAGVCVPRGQHGVKLKAPAGHVCSER